MNKKNFFNNFLLFIITVIVCLTVSEFIFRYILFHSTGKFENLRRSEFYSNQYSDDYWKLYYLFRGISRPPENPHPYLGWVGKFNSETLEHNIGKEDTGKRKVLLYGDSFAHCEEGVECFEDILNKDSAFNSNYYLLNYGALGYGLDQIYLLFDSTVDRYPNPFVIISIMPGDIDRSILSVRTGQKPYFILENNDITLKGVPINPVPANFFKENPPDINSYLFNKFIYSDLNPFKPNPGFDEKIRSKILTLNEMILQKVVKKLRSSNLDFVFLIYEDLGTGDGNWRIDFLESFFLKNKLPFIYSSELMNNDSTFVNLDINNYYLKGNGHPTTHYNWLVSQEFKKYLFNFREYVAVEINRRNNDYK